MFLLAVNNLEGWFVTQILTGQSVLPFSQVVKKQAAKMFSMTSVISEGYSWEWR